mmetsp:Transcript_39696/g.100671  ORF Transcript_39696/g.100671 Transcript_39696/m.100671 type:complete len:232 (+) Transcript_39696:906-1601(+)
MHLRDAAVEKVPDGALNVEVARRNLEVGDDVGEPVLLRAAEGDAHVAVLAVPQHPRLRVGVDVVHVADRLQPLDRAANQLRQRLPGVQHLHGRALHSLQRDVVQVSGCFAKGNKLQAEVDRAAPALAAQVQAELVLLAVHIRRHRQHRHAQRVVRPDHVLVRQAHQQLLGIRVPTRGSQRTSEGGRSAGALGGTPTALTRTGQDICAASGRVGVAGQCCGCCRGSPYRTMR